MPSTRARARVSYRGPESAGRYARSLFIARFGRLDAHVDQFVRVRSLCFFRHGFVNTPPVLTMLGCFIWIAYMIAYNFKMVQGYLEL